LASTAGRPDLTEAVVKITEESWGLTAAAIRRAQSKGWILNTVDPVGVLQWFAAVFDGRVRYELREPLPDLSGLNDVTRRAMAFILFGETE